MMQWVTFFEVKVGLLVDILLEFQLERKHSEMHVLKLAVCSNSFLFQHGHSVSS